MGGGGGGEGVPVVLASDDIGDLSAFWGYHLN